MELNDRGIPKGDFWKAVAAGLAEDAKSRRRPADPGDFRFEITDLAQEPADDDGVYFDDYEGGRYLLEMIDDHGIVTETHRMDDPYSFVEAAREVQCIPMEERWAMDAERGW